MASVNVKKDRYDAHKKEVCDANNEFKPRHAAALILCLLEEIRENQEKCQCCGSEDKIVSNEETTQSGVVNVSADINSIIKNAKKQK